MIKASLVLILISKCYFFSFGLSTLPLKSQVITSIKSMNTINSMNSWIMRSYLTTSSNIEIPSTNFGINYRNEHWRNQWNMIKSMRKNVIAEVDTMGATALAGTIRQDAEFRFGALLGTMLSPQTRDKQTSQAFRNLIHLLDSKPLLPSNILENLDLETIEEAIKMVSFYKVKAKNILVACKICKEKYNNDIPNDINKLLEFPGIGPKIAYLTFTIAWKKTLGICVDTHVHRITNRLGWVNTWLSKTNGPEKSRIALQEFLPQELWEDINETLVGFGQTICSARTPKCNQCQLTSTCKYYNQKDFMR